MSRRIVDLTLTIREGMTTFPVPWHPFVEVTQLGRHGLEQRETRKLVLGTHTGTHCDAPAHFVPGGRTIDQVPLEDLCGPATVVDMTWAAERQEIGAGQLEEAIAGRPTDRLLLRYDWDSRIDTPTYYPDHPYLSTEAARWLVGSGCRLVGMDTPMPDDPRNGRGTPNDSPNHKVLLGAKVILVEYLTNLRALRSPVVELFVLPLKIEHGDGAPVRCIAIEEV